MLGPLGLPHWSCRMELSGPDLGELCVEGRDLGLAAFVVSATLGLGLD